MTQVRMPVVFANHSNPMLMLDHVKGEPYRIWASQLPVPRAILVFSAHWETPQLSCGELRDHSQLIYDFGGFPRELYQVQYPAPGAPWLLDDLRAMLPGETLPVVERGLDHGVYVPLLHMWPNAEVPVLQLSLPRDRDARGLYELGKRLANLREQGVLLMGAGALTHNLRAWNPRHTGGPVEWAQVFDQWVEDTLLAGNIEALLDWDRVAPNAKMNHPTAEHFLPLLIAAGAGEGLQVSFPTIGFEYGVFSSRSVQFG